jgi:uncharacterized protein DUF5309
MALNSVNLFAAFDVTDGAQDRDISPILEEALYYDLNLLGSLNVAFDSPIFDIIHYWNEEQLNADTVTASASTASNGTALALTTNHGNRLHVGDQLYDTAINTTEVMQVTAVSASAATITRGFNSTTAASLAADAVLAVIRVEQEGSDIGSDKTLNPTVRNNNSHIFSTYDLQITGSQLARKMATNEYQDFLARQLAARAIELKIGMTRAVLYSEKSSSTGSDTVYRSMAGLRNWARDNSGVTNASSEALAYSVLNLHNKSLVDKGLFPDTLALGTGLVGSIAGIDSSNRRLRESDSQAGYVVQEVLLNQGNLVQVVVDSRVKTGDAALFTKDKIAVRPMSGRGMFVLAGADWVDGKKRRILGEWTMEVRNPEAVAFLSNKT